MSLAIDAEYETKQKLKEKRDNDKNKWSLEVKKLKDILACNNFEVLDLEDNVEKQKNNIDTLKIEYIGKNGLDIEHRLCELEEKIKAFELNKGEILQKRTPEDKKLIETYQKHKQIYDDFCHKMAIDKRILSRFSLPDRNDQRDYTGIFKRMWGGLIADA